VGGVGLLRLLPFVRGATLSLSGLDFFSGGSPVDFAFTFCSLVLLFEPGGRPGPRLMGAVELGGADLSSFSDFLLTGADKLEASMSLSSIFSRSLIVLLMPFALRFFEGLTGNGCEDSLIIWPSITWVRTCGLTTHFGVGTSPASPSVEAVVFVWVLGVVETFDEFVLLGALSNEGGLLMLGGPRLGMGGLTSLVRVGGPNELSEFAWMGVGGTDVVGMDVEAAGI